MEWQLPATPSHGEAGQRRGRGGSVSVSGASGEWAGAAAALRHR